jgi:hypothetical protein
MATREELEAQMGQVWDTTELQRDFAVKGFQAPFVVATRKPRLYYAFRVG